MVESIQSPTLQLPVEHLAYIATSPPEVDVVLIVGDRVLDRLVSEVVWQGGEKHTRIIVRRTLAEPKAT